eukprot:5957841-Prymnesium_polylepis.1
MTRRVDVDDNPQRDGSMRARHSTRHHGSLPDCDMHMCWRLTLSLATDAECRIQKHAVGGND